MEDTAVVKLVAGMEAPEFSLVDARGAQRSLSEFRGRNVIVYFYPQAATPGCTTEACDFRDSLASFQGKGYEVLGVSPDSREAIASFADDLDLDFPLLADEDGSVARQYGAWGEKLVNGVVTDGLVRSTVVVDPEGKVRLTKYQVAADGHVADLKAALGV